MRAIALLLSVQSRAVPIALAWGIAVATPAVTAQPGAGRPSPATGESTTSPASPTAPAELPPGPPVASPPAAPPPAPRQRPPGDDGAPPTRPRGTAADAPMTRDALQASHRRQLEAFDAADVDRDGTLSPAEMNAYRAALRRDRTTPSPPKGYRPPDKGGPAQGVPNPRG